MPPRGAIRLDLGQPREHRLLAVEPPPVHRDGDVVIGGGRHGPHLQGLLAGHGQALVGHGGKATGTGESAGRVRLNDMADFAVVDLETNGFRPGRDRVVEVAVVRMTSSGAVVDEWSTLVDPEGPVRHGRVHGIFTSHVQGAPVFGDVAGDLLARMDGAVCVAHNARFDSAFLAAELGRVGVDAPQQWACTLELVVRLEFGLFRSLRACCATLGVPHAGAHSALGDARSAAHLLSFLLALAYERDIELSIPDPFQAGSVPAESGRVLHRPVQVERPKLRRGSAAPHAAPALPVADAGAVLAYMELLDDVLEDRVITPEEVQSLVTLAAEWALSPKDLAALHRHFVRELAVAALADGVLERHEVEDLRAVADLLSVDRDVVFADLVALEVDHLSS